jgi:hypothetical protein
MLPVQSRYRGQHSKHTWYGKNWFRSKLEAKWAVFYDQLGLSWRYEPGPFDLGDRTYTPDFWIEEWRCHVEIKFLAKKLWPSLHLRRLCKLKPKCAVLLVTGQPELGEYEIRYFKKDDVLDGTQGWVIGEGRKNKNAFYLAQKGRKPIYLTGHGNPTAPRPTERPLYCLKKIKRLYNAYGNAMLGPRLLRNGRFITSDYDCPWCADMATSPKHK